MREIDEMDMLGYLSVRAWDEKRETDNKKPKVKKYIDEIWSSVKP